MRKYLVGATAAIAGVALALPASAEEMDDMMEGVSISGYMNHDFGFGSYDGGEMTVEDFHMETDAELTFTASGTTDGGLKVTAAIEVTGSGGGSGIDESHLTIAGGFGSINIGANDTAANMHGNKGVGGGYGGGGYYDCGESWVPASCGAPPPNSDAQGIRYSTPAIGGFQAGVSFQPQHDTEGSTSGDMNDKNLIAVGANFSGDMGGTSLTIGANHVSKKTGGDDSETEKSWGIGTAIGIGGTTLSLRYDTKSEQSMNAAAGGKPGDIASFGVGVDHTIGALSFGIGYGVMKEEDAAMDDDMSNFVYTHMAGNDESAFGEDMMPSASIGSSESHDRKHTMVSAGATYDLGGGVKVSAGIHHGKVTNMPMGDSGSLCIAATAADDGNTGELGGTADDGMADADGDCETGEAMATYTELKDIDDLGFGLRIAFSF